jgi:ABC-type transporter Mla MlaB component
MTEESRPTTNSGRPMGPCPTPTVTLAITGPPARADLPQLFEHTCRLLEGDGVQLLLCEVSDIGADAVAVDALARLALAARRRGCRLELRGASAELRELVAFMGLTGVLGDSRRRGPRRKS